MTDTTVEVPTVTYTIFAGSKVGDGNYGNNEYGIHGQIVLPVDTSLEVVEANVDELSTFLQVKVAQRLGIDWTKNDDGTVQYAEPEQAAPKAKKRAPGPQKDSSGPSNDELWHLLQDELNDGNVKSFWDNRETKKGKQPDFKHKDSGKGLWLGGKPGAPGWFNIDGDGTI